MMFSKNILACLLAATSAVALPSPQFGGSPGGSGLGPYPAGYKTDPSLPGHTIYVPNNVPSDLTLPILVWANGACGANGLAFQDFLTEVSSHGFFVIANGEPNGSGQTTSQVMRDSVDWVTSDAAKSAYGFLEPSRIVAAGQSCGGVEAYDLAGEERVSAIGIFNSGLMTPAESERIATKITKPIFYFNGGSGDIAYANGERDYSLLPADTPAWKGNLPVGHDGTYWQPNGGKFAVATTRFLEWILKGDTAAAEFFTGGGAAGDGWQVVSQNLDKIDVSPL